MELESTVSEAIGATLALSILDRFDDSAAKQIVLAQGFSPAQIAAAVERLEGHEGGQPEELCILVKPDGRGDELLQEGVRDRHLLPSTDSLVKIRNARDTRRYALFALAEQSDAQSLAQLTTVKDRDILKEKNALRHLADHLWGSAGGGKAAPTEFHAHLQVVHDTVGGAMRGGVPLMRLSRFAAVATSRLLRAGHPTTEAVVDAVYSSLPELEMFSDTLPTLKGAASERGKRIKANFFASQLLKENGSEMKAEELARRAERTEFSRLDAHGEVKLPQEEQDRLRDLCRRYCLGESGLVDQIEWDHFRQILKANTSTKLGDRARELLSGRPDGVLIDAFDELGAQDRLNAQDPDVARAIIEHDAIDSDQQTLLEALDSDTRATIRRLASRASRDVSNFATYLLREIHGLDQGEGICWSINVDAPRGAAGKHAVGCHLFALLHRSLFAAAATASQSGGVRLCVDEKLTTLDRHLHEAPPAKGSGAKDSWKWEPLELEVRFSRDGNQGFSHRVTWKPEELDSLILLSASAQCAEVRDATIALDANQSDLSTSLRSLREGDLDELVKRQLPEACAPIQRWIELRAHFLDRVAEEGLSSHACDEYFNGWGGTLSDAKLDFNLAGSRDSAFSAFMNLDMALEGADAYMLPTHPLRARWLGDYLGKLEDSLKRALAGELQLAPKNEAFYLRWLESRSPHDFPPYHSLCQDNLLLASAEHGWIEKYEPVSGQNRSTDWHAEVDIEALRAIADECINFLSFHPFKVHGLSLLIFQDGDSTLSTRLIDSVLSKARKIRNGLDLRLRVHILGGGGDMARVSRSLEGLDDEASSEQLLPRLEVEFHEWDEAGPLPESINPKSIDIAVVPNLLVQSKQVLEDLTKREGDGSHRPIYSSPRHVVNRTDAGANMMVDLLPASPGNALLDWSTLGVTHHRSQQLADPSHFQLVIDTAKSEGLFRQLHKVALWVITLDSYISRREIERLEDRPEVITFKEGVGKNKAYNIVVSSKMGRDFVIPRLAHRLKAIFGVEELDDELREQQAETLYDASCELAPGIILRSLGGGWTLNEIIGLVATKRRLTAEFGGVPARKHLDAWLSLDEQSAWFEGAKNEQRADLLHVRLQESTSPPWQLELTVIESKMGKRDLARKGHHQVATSLELLEDAFRPRGLAGDDGRLWRETLTEAVEACSSKQGTEIRGSVLTEEAREALLNGDYELIGPRGVVVCHLTEADEDSVEEEGNIKTIYSGRTSLLKLLSERWKHASAVQSIEAKGSTEGPVKAPGEDAAEREHPAAEVGPRSTNERGPEPVADGGTSIETKGLPEGERQALIQDIYDCLGGLKIKTANPPAGTETFHEGPRFFRVGVKLAVGQKMATLDSARRDLELALGLEQGSQIRIFGDKGLAWIEAPKSPDHCWSVTASELWQEFEKRHANRSTTFEVPIGRDLAGSMVCIDFASSTSPHILIAGATGSGKSVALNTLLAGATHLYGPDSLRLFLVDKKQVELADFESLPHVDGNRVIVDSEGAIRVLSKAVEEMDNRYEKFAQLRFDSVGRTAKSLFEYNERAPEPLPRWLVVLDEYSNLVANKEHKAEIEEKLMQLSEKARAAGIHVVVATQKPVVDVINTVVKSNLVAALAFRVTNSSDSRVILDENGAEALAGAGDALLKTAKGMERIQVAIKLDG